MGGVPGASRPGILPRFHRPSLRVAVPVPAGVFNGSRPSHLILYSFRSDMDSSPSSSPLRAVFRQIRPALLAAGALSLFINLLVFVSPLFTMQVYDRVLTSRNGMTLLLLFLIALALFVSYAALEHFRNRVMVQAGVSFDHLVSSHAFDTALADALRIRGVHHAQLLRDVDTLRDVLSGGVATGIMDVPWTPIFLGLCFLLHPLIGLVALLGAVAILVIAVLNERITREPLTAASLRGLHALNRLTSSLRNAEAIRGLGMEHAVRAMWRALHHDALRASVQAGERGGTLLALSKFLRLAIQIGVMAAGAYLAIRQEISGGVLFAASIIMGRALAPIESVVGQWRAFAAARASFDRLERALKSRPVQRRMKLPKLRGELSIENLTVLIPGTRVPVVRGVSLRIAAGEILGLVGESGSGKSSLARALVGAWPIAEGAVRIDGNDLRHFNAGELGRAFGYLPQDVELFAGSIRDNIARFREEATDEQVVEAAVLASVHAMIQRLPEGYETHVGEDGASLSGGQRQRVGLARALFGRPAFVLLDEPNSNLDNEGDRALAQALQNLRAQRTTALVISHRPNLLAAVDRIVLMQAGRIRYVGTRDEVLPVLRGDAAPERPKVTPMPWPGKAPAQTPPFIRSQVHATRQ